MTSDPRSTARPRSSRPGTRVACVRSLFHEDLTAAMVRSARRELEASGVSAEDVFCVDVPGSFELGLVARRLARRADVDCVLCFGLVLKGETTHDVYVAQGAVQAIVQASLETDKPVLFGVLTCDTLEQARDRALPPDEGGRLDKGREVAAAAVETLLALDRAETVQRDSVGGGLS